jgi:hypothetical protein
VVRAQQRVWWFFDLLKRGLYLIFSFCAKNVPRVGLDIGNPTSVFLLTSFKLEDLILDFEVRGQ